MLSRRAADADAELAEQKQEVQDLKRIIDTLYGKNKDLQEE